MTDVPGHFAQYEDFKRGATLEANAPQVRVEALFLAVFHLIDACAARVNVHINKHRRVRHELERNPEILGDRTEEVWMAFQDLETRIRPKFVYGRSWGPEDLESAFEKAAIIEDACKEALE